MKMKATHRTPGPIRKVLKIESTYSAHMHVEGSDGEAHVEIVKMSSSAAGKVHVYALSRNWEPWIKISEQNFYEIAIEVLEANVKKLPLPEPPPVPTCEKCGTSHDINEPCLDLKKVYITIIKYPSHPSRGEYGITRLINAVLVKVGKYSWEVGSYVSAETVQEFINNPNYQVTIST